MAKKILIASAIFTIVIACALFFYSHNDLAHRLARSETFIQMNSLENSMAREATISYSANRLLLRKHRKSEFEAVIGNRVLSEKGRSDSLAKMGLVQSGAEREDFKKFVLISRRLRSEFPELAALSTDKRKEIFLRAIKLSDGGRPVRYLPLALN